MNVLLLYNLVVPFINQAKITLRYIKSKLKWHVIETYKIEGTKEATKEIISLVWSVLER